MCSIILSVVLLIYLILQPHFYLQILMNVWLSLLVMQMPHAPTRLDLSHVHATQDTVEME